MNILFVNIASHNSKLNMSTKNSWQLGRLQEGRIHQKLATAYQKCQFLCVLKSTDWLSSLACHYFEFCLLFSASIGSRCSLKN